MIQPMICLLTTRTNALHSVVMAFTARAAAGEHRFEVQVHSFRGSHQAGGALACNCICLHHAAVSQGDQKQKIRSPTVLLMWK